MPDLFDIAKKTMMTGIGFALKTKDEVEEWAKELATRGELSENEGEKFVDEMTKRYDEARENLEKKVEKSVKEMLDRLKVPTAEEMDALKAEIESIKKKIG